MKNVSRKIIAFVSAIAILVTGIVVDSNNAQATYSPEYFEHTVNRAPGQDNDINQADEYGMPYYYTGQTFDVTGMEYKGKVIRKFINYKDIVIDEANRGYTNYYVLSYPLPESIDDCLVEVRDQNEAVSDNIWHTSQMAQDLRLYEAVEVNGELRYQYSHMLMPGVGQVIVEPIYITDVNGKILSHESVYPKNDNPQYVLAKTAGGKDTFGVCTINSQSTITATSDNENIVAKVDGRSFILEYKTAGSANVTVTDDAGNSALIKVMVKDKATTPVPTPTAPSADNTPAPANTNTYPVGSFAKTTINDNGEKDTTIVTQNGVYETSLSSVNDVVPEGAKFTSAEVPPTAEYFVTVNEAFKKFKKDNYNNSSQVTYKIGKIVEFDLADMSGAAIHQLDGYVTVSMDMPSDMVVKENQVVKVYRVAEDGTVVPCPTIVENGVIQFATNHFSTYVFVIEDQVASTAGTVTNAKKSPKTGE
ncbi:MAG: hypothetical protein IKP29_04475, partial [Pseudobutyrivibrio sp.]|nr:hypothetical protein [Pseudobutyrivibrio sp.]